MQSVLPTEKFIHNIIRSYSWRSFLTHVSSTDQVSKLDMQTLIPHDIYVIMGAIVSQITSLAIAYATVSGAARREHQSSVSPTLVREIHRWPVNSPHKWPVTRKMFPIDDVIMARDAYSSKHLYDFDQPQKEYQITIPAKHIGWPGFGRLRGVPLPPCLENYVCNIHSLQDIRQKTRCEKSDVSYIAYLPSDTINKPYMAIYHICRLWILNTFINRYHEHFFWKFHPNDLIDDESTPVHPFSEFGTEPMCCNSTCPMSYWIV